MDRPKVYAKYSELQRRDNEFTLNTYLELVRWKKFPKILDVGCGDGITTLEVLEPCIPPDYKKLVGCDLQEKMFEFVKESNKNPRVGFVQFDIAAEKLLADKFDHIFSFFTFHWVVDLRKAFKNVYDLLTPGGDMLINLASETSYYEVLKRQLEKPRWVSYFSSNLIPPLDFCKNPEEILRTHLTENGFVDVKVIINEKAYLYENWVHFLKSFLALDPIISKLNMEEKEEYLVDYFFSLRDVFSGFEEPNGEIRMPYNLLVVYASKSEEILD